MELHLKNLASAQAGSACKSNWFSNISWILRASSKKRKFGKFSELDYQTCNTALSGCVVTRTI
jgi:hypothetical protein